MLAPRRQPGTDFAIRDRLAGQPMPSTRDSAEIVRGLEAEIAFIHESIARNKRELTALIGDGKERRLTRAGDELNAAVETMRGATDTILGLAEAADDSARTLAASLKDDYKRGLTQDIQDQIIKIYETCNFQDIAGQHIGKVMRTLVTVEEQLAVILARCSGAHAATQTFVEAPARDHLLNGPKVEGDAGHATQNEIDRLFV